MAAAPLIEGFLDEMHQHGYPVNGATGFVDRLGGRDGRAPGPVVGRVRVAIGRVLLACGLV